MNDKTTPPPQVWPTLRATDARALIRFLSDAFGFVATAVHGEGEFVAHAELRWPLGGGLMLGSTRDDPDNPWNLKPGTFGAYIVADDIEALHARAAAAGAEIIRAPFTTDYGSEDFTARDPEGNLWHFGTYRGEPH
ncbi:VOC family protein [Actinoplanes sp. NPDC026670]|uniref:VOC family protein n=1 Tax=Actinoplanes sp. NPDC026670 TaxID=3154700 RepID=UPI0033D47871